MLGAVVLTMAACTDSNTPERVTAPSPVPGAPAVKGTITTTITTPGNYQINGAVWTAKFTMGVGTGNLNPFLRVQASPGEKGFNTNFDKPRPYDVKNDQWTKALPLNTVPSLNETVSPYGAGPWREFILDANEANSNPDAQFSIDQLDIYVCSNAAVKDLSQSQYVTLQGSPSTYGCTKAYNIDASASLGATDGSTSGSGNDVDYRILVPKAAFGNAANTACPYDGGVGDCGYYVLVYIEMGGVGGDWVTGSTFEEMSTIQRPVFSISGTKYNDLNANSARDAGEAGLAGWTISAYDASNNLASTAVTDASGNFILNGLDNGTYLVCETPQAGWIESDPSNVEGASCSAILGAAARGYTVTINAANVTGILFGNYQQGSLQIVKRVVNDNGGTKTVSDFSVTSSAGSLTFGSGVADGANTLKYSSQVINVNPGSFTFSEANVAGYTEGTWSCTGATATGTAYNSGSVTVPAGTAVVCTITNNDDPGTLQIVKRVVNDNGGTATASSFSIVTSAGTITFGTGVADGANTLKYSSQVFTVNAGSYTFSESDIAGYTEGTWSCTGATATGTAFNAGSVTVPNGGTVVCTITNDDSQGSLQIVKRVVNDNGGTKTVSDFSVVSSAGSLTFGTGVADGANTLKYSSQVINVNAGSYTFSEANVAGYTEGTWSCTGATATGTAYNAGSVTVPSGGAVVCTITNNDDPGSLQLVKRVVNDNGGTKTVTDFGITTSAGTPTFGTGVADGANTLKYSSQVMSVNAGSYTFAELNVAGYTEGTWSCTPTTATGTAYNAGSVTVANGVAVVCTITNDDDQGSLQIVKRVVNDNGGTLGVSSFGITSSAGSLTFGSGVADGANTLKYSSQVIPVNAGSYTFSETNVAGYTEGTWSCTGATATGTAYNAGSVTVPAATAVVCTITNNDDPGSLQIVKRVVNDNGGTLTASGFGVVTSAGTITFGAGVADGANTLKYSSQVFTVNAGSYTFSENNVTGYTEGTWACTGATASGTAYNSGSVTVPLGTAVVCTITNDDQPGTIILVKNVKGAGGTFTFPTTGSGLPNPISLTVATDNTNSVTYNTLNAGTYTIQETIPPDYTLTGLSCTTGGVTNYPTGSLSTITLTNGATVTCTYENTHTLVTRTQGFWATHLWIAQAVWNGGTVGGNTFPGIADKTLCGNTLDVAKLMGGFWSNIAKTTGGDQRSDVSKAKMQLLQQMLAAILNHEAFGSSPSGSVSISDAKAAFCTSSDLTTIRDAMSAMGYFNESGDSGLFTPGVSANVKDAKAVANLSYWDYLN